MWPRKSDILYALVFADLFPRELVCQAQLWLPIAPASHPRFIRFEFCVCISAEKAEYTRQLSGIAFDALPELFGCT
jgi:hypothetical protein